MTSIRCVPRLGCDFTQVRTIELGVAPGYGELDVRDALTAWFADRGLEEVVYDVGVDNDGYYAVINDEAYYEEWGAPLL